MKRKIVWSDEARADVNAIDRETAIGILRSLARYNETNAGDVKQLAGYDPVQYRFRVGDYRIRFRLPGEQEMHIVRILHRKDAYR